jgi:hypothetical protein
MIAPIMSPGVRHAADKELRFMIGARESVVRRFDNGTGTTGDTRTKARITEHLRRQGVGGSVHYI